MIYIYYLHRSRIYNSVYWVEKGGGCADIPFADPTRRSVAAACGVVSAGTGLQVGIVGVFV